jgi:hypothetical protein
VTLAELLAIAAAIALASGLQVVTGFGFSLICAPVLVAVTDPVTSVSILAVVGTLNNALTLVTGRRRPEVLRRDSVALVAWALPGLVLGAYGVSRLPADAVRAAIGVLVLAALAQRHLMRVRPATSLPRRWAAAIAGGTAGALSTSTGLSGPPLVLYFTARGTTPRLARDTLAVVFLLMGVLGLIALTATGTLTVPAETALLPLAALAGTLLGHRIFDRLLERTHGRIVTAMLVLAALTALVSAVR